DRTLVTTRMNKPRQPELIENFLGSRRVRIEAGAIAGNDDEPGQTCHLARFPPVQEVEEGLGSDQKMEVASILQGLKRLYGVGGAGALELRVGDLEPWMLANGQRRHLEAVVSGGELRQGFVRWLGGRHEEHPVQAQRLADLVGDKQVAEVD